MNDLGYSAEKLAAIFNGKSMPGEREIRRDQTQLLFEILRAWGCHSNLRMWRQDAEKLSGMGELSGLIAPNGRRLEIAVKGPRGRQTKEQKVAERVVTSLGGLYILAFSLADVDAALVPLVGPRR